MFFGMQRRIHSLFIDFMFELTHQGEHFLHSFLQLRHDRLHLGLSRQKVSILIGVDRHAV